jgi:hypothetical protein
MIDFGEAFASATENTTVMAGIKRKQPEVAGAYVKGASKKSKVEPKKSKKPARAPTPPSDISELEAETDSEPIVESDTTEHSGDDDGVSWPSDDEELSAPALKNGGVKLPVGQTNPKERDGRTKLPTSQAKQAGKEKASTDGVKAANNCGSSAPIRPESMLTISKLPPPAKRMQSKKLLLKSVKRQSPMRTQ